MSDFDADATLPDFEFTTPDSDVASALDRAEGLMEAKDFEGAASLAECVLDGFDLNMLSRAALVRGKALGGALLAQIKDSEQAAPDREAFRGAWTMCMLALSLEPENKEARYQVDKLNNAVRELDSAAGVEAAGSGSSQDEQKHQPACEHHHHHDHHHETSYVVQELDDDFPLDVIVVGAGASGVGVGIMLAVCMY